MYVVVDIETTGGSAKYHRIIEIAIVIFDGKEAVEHFSSLVNPGVFIPPYITALTGIDDDMVADAPVFEDMLPYLKRLLQNGVFVAHNVNFDYGFIKKEFALAGERFEMKKLCTVRLSRKIIPGLSSYALGNLCRHLGIVNEARHRALGDAKATVELLKYLIDNDTNDYLTQSLKRNSKEATLPANLSKEEYESLPEATGVYYFHDKRGKVIYVGKARNIKSRITGHFTGSSAREKRMFHEKIHHISYELCGNELIALLHESREIRRLWPEYNRSQKSPVVQYGLYDYYDRNGYRRLSIGKVQKGVRVIRRFRSPSEGRRVVREMVTAYGLCAKLSGLQNQPGPCDQRVAGICGGACVGEESAEAYNRKVAEALNEETAKGTFVFVGPGRSPDEHSIVLIEEGLYKGYGYLPDDTPVSSPDPLKDYIHYHPDNPDIQKILNMYMRNPANQKIVRFE